APADCAETTRQAIAIGLAGGSIEDATGDRDRPQYPLEAAAERVAAAAEAAGDLPFVLTARAESFLVGNPDLDDTIARLRAYAAAGADVVYAPALPDLDAIRAVCAAVDRPVNVVMGLRPPFYDVDTLAAAGVKRISVGGAVARAAFGAVLAAGREIREQGTFSFAETAVPGSALAKLMDRPR
ncbi:MAG: isocitrate lyase/phosphoenolpyruvate mutase family protein, partial [Alphaproteobacteria bacterium]|nr:isocitrate lyase/phosphoenolpyruvate mutase family protein [Alphaproteobacteria bacterium]